MKEKNSKSYTIETKKQVPRFPLQSLTFTLIMAFLVLSGVATFVYASDVSDAGYRGSITVSNNGTATTNVSTVFTLNTQSLIDTNKLNSSANDCAIQVAAGTDVAFMPSVNSSYPWCTWVPSIGEDAILYQYLYTSGVTGGEIRYFPGSSGMETADSASLEPGDNFTVELKGLLGEPGCLVRKDGAFSITYKVENFDTYTEVDVPGKLAVTAVTATATNADRDEDVYLYKDMGVDYFDGLDIDFEIFINSDSLDTSFGGMAITNTISSISGLAATDIATWAYRVNGASYRIYLSRGNQVVTDMSAISADTPYYCTLTREAGNDTVSLLIYSDSLRTTLLDTLGVAGFGVEEWRYIFGFINYNDAGGGKDFDGYVQNVYEDGNEDVRVAIFGGVSIATSVVIDDYEIRATANSSDLELYINDILEDNTPLGGVPVPDTGDNWIFVENDVMPYMEYLTIEVGGVQQQYIEWEYATTFSDQSGNSHDATPTFRTASSDPNISANLTSFAGIMETTAPPAAGQTGWDIMTSVPDAPSGFFGEFDPGSMTFLGSGYVSTFSTATGIPLALIVFPYAFGIAIGAGFIAWYISSGGGKQHNRGSLLAMAATSLLVMLYFVYGAGGVIPGWILLPFAIEVLVFIVWRQTPSPF